MRVIQVINNFGIDRGGAERIARNLHQALLDKGVDARIVAIEECETAGLANGSSLGLTNPRDPRAILRLDRALRGLVRRGDIVHVHLFPSTLHVSALRQLKRLPCPTVMTEHNTWNRRRGTIAGRSLDRLIYRGIDRIVAISEATRRALVETYPSLADKTSVVENGVALRNERMPRRAAREGPTRIISVGRLTHAKNLDTAIEALGLLERDDWSWTIVGDGSDRKALEAQAHNLGLAGRIRFTGHLDDVYPELEAADLFLMPSRWDGFGLAAVEAMNSGLPLVVSDVPGLREVVGEAAVPPVPPGRADLLATAIASLLDNPALRQRLGSLAFQRSLRFDRERMLDGYLAIWKRSEQRFRR